jgi:hypothetical protein
MNSFFQYLKQWLVVFFKNFGEFFYNWVVYKWINVPDDFTSYNDIFKQYSGDFGGLGWTFFVLWWILFAAMVFGILWLVIHFLRKYIRFNKKELDKEKMAEQIEQLNNELYEAVTEKNKILNLKVGSLGLRPAGAKVSNEEEEAQNTIKEVSSRFSRLVQVDNKYAKVDTTIPDVEGLTLEELCNKFRNFAASSLGLYYKIGDIRCMFAGMGTSKLLILEGISGTGKTSLPYALGKFFVNDAAICSVQPSWRDRTELMGYFNEFTKKFNETDFLRAVYEATYRKDVNIIVLDEMNLARIEYYFAEFLSIMEMPNINEWKIQLIAAPDPSDPTHIKDGKLLIPQNVYFFGTANNDDSTFTITDKVYDRAVSVIFNDRAQAFTCDYQDSLLLPFSQLNGLYKDAIVNNPISQTLLGKFSELDNFCLKNFKLVFGNRIMKQLNLFLPIYMGCGGSDIDGLDFFFRTKILRKFQSLNIGFLKDELKSLIGELDRLFGKNNFTMSKSYVDDLIKMN